MAKPLAGIRVLEAAAWTFVPAAGAVLAEWGAEVIKIEPREGGDPQRGLVTMGLIPGGADGVNYMIEVPNRGKKSIGIDMNTAGGQEVVHELAKTCDVFLTSYLPSNRKKFRIEVEDIRAVNPDIIYARGSGYGPQGPDADKAGYDGVSFWSRGGICDAFTRDLPEPVMQTPAFGDLIGGLTIAGGIATALYKRKATGETSIVDVSLLGLAAWTMSPGVTASMLYGGDPMPNFTHRELPNPLVGTYKTKDDRYITLMMLQGDRFYPEFMTVIGRSDLMEDKRFAEGHARFENRGELIDILDEEFAARPSTSGERSSNRCRARGACCRSPVSLRHDSGGRRQRLHPRSERDERRTVHRSHQPDPVRPASRPADGRTRTRPAHRGDPARGRHRVGEDRAVQTTGRCALRSTVGIRRNRGRGM